MRRLLLSLVLLGATAPVLIAADPAPAIGDLRQAGTVYLEPSCAPAVRDDFQRATALLHSFFYDEARRAFEAVAKRDPRCAMAQWGVAMTYWHPLWTPPAPEEMTAGQAAIAKAVALGGKTEVTRGLIGALATFYAVPTKAGAPGEIGVSCHGSTGGGDHPARAAAYAAAMEALYAPRKDDVEVAAFYALALLASASPSDQTLARQGRATTILEPFFATYPKHPGVIHYLIHGYDFPPIADKGLAAAKAYASIAPWVPHALHMPAHIFVRLGMWGDVIQSNLASADASRQHEARTHPDATDGEELHALDYLIYGYLQIADDAAAHGVVERTLRVTKTFPEVDFAASYALGAVPARYALERKQWADAASLATPALPTLAGIPTGSGHLAFARALGAARAGQTEAARKGMGELEAIARVLTPDPRQAYFGRQATMQLGVVKAFVAVAEGHADEGERLLREAADHDDALGKHPVSPGTLIPSRELLADFLAERGRPQEALAEYEACLKLNPRRFNSLAGAGRAAEKAGDRDRARTYYTDLLGMVAKGADRPEITEARAFLAGERRAAR